jgi:hypothetical protein
MEKAKYAIDALKSVAAAIKDGAIQSKEVADQVYAQALKSGGLDPDEWPKEDVFKMAQPKPEYKERKYTKGNQEVTEVSQDGGKTWQPLSTAPRYKPASEGGGSRTGREKPMPASAVKLQQDALDAVGVASKLQADVGGLVTLIDTGKLELGPVKNIINAGRNKLGASNEVSANLTNFKTTLEEIRNNILMLAKGVQTDGDALRAYNTLLDNINDPKVVRQQLLKIQENNARNEQLQQSKVNTIRAEYGKGEGDFSGYTGQLPALGKGDVKTNKPTNTGKSVQRNGKSISSFWGN